MLDEAAEAETYDGDKFLIDGTSSHKSYMVIGRRGEILLGIKMYGLTPGENMGVAGKTYLFARVRSCRDKVASEQMDNIAGIADTNVVSIADKDLNLVNAWPDFEFEKTNDDGHDRASLAVGVFIRGSLSEDPETVLERLEKVDMFQALAEYVVKTAGPQYAVQTPRMIAKWLREKATPHIEAIGKGVKVKKAVKVTTETFAETVEEELVGMHTAQLQKMLQKSVAAATGAGLIEQGIDPDGEAGAHADHDLEDGDVE
jgi:hypothetical protein